jgi:hypothetical protein
MLAESSFGYATMGDEIDHRNSSTTALSDKLDRFPEVVRDRPTAVR